jgi:hypothetical protein
VKPNTSRRLGLLVGASLLVTAYLATRDTVTVKCHLPRKDVREIVSGLQEWSSPKFFRQIIVDTNYDGTVLAWVNEPGDRASVTQFTNLEGHWRKCAWFLLGPGAGGVVRYGPVLPNLPKYHDEP